MFISGQCAKKFKNSFLRRNIYTKLQKYRSKNPPPKFLHFYAENAKILAYMQNKGPFCIYFA